MLYLIYEFFSLNIFQYITVRGAIAFFLSFILSVSVLPMFIAWAKRRNANQPIYELAPQTHQKKSNTPTMGGLFFILLAVLSTLICARLDNSFVVGAIVCLVGFALIGVKDDMAKILGKSNKDGLTPRAKLFLQAFVAFIVAMIIYFQTPTNGLFYVPFYKHPLFDMQLFAVAFWIIVMVSASNAVNLTDGLDGLATVPAIFSILTLCIFIYLSGHAVLSSYLLVPKVSFSGELVIVGLALIGSLIGFLWHNCYPAEIFMGDTGSLSVGAIIGYMAIVSKNEILLILIGFVFVIETISVILQVGSFKTRKKRIFLMAPIHHHFEMKGWAENKIIVRFWIIALISNLIALTALKVR